MLISEAFTPDPAHIPFPRTVDDIIGIVTMVAKRHHPEISYVGLFGSFVKGEQHINSDIDIVVGYHTPDPEYKVWDTGDLTRELEMFSERAFDIVWVKDNEPPHWYKPMHGLLEGMKIYENERDPEWFPRNQTVASRHLAEQEKRGESPPRAPVPIPTPSKDFEGCLFCSCRGGDFQAFMYDGPKGTEISKYKYR
jgi:predicted nucleotidyltransferase